MTLISKMNAGLLHVAGAVGVMMLSSTTVWASCDLYKDGPPGMNYNAMTVFMYSDTDCSSSGSGICCQAFCFKPNCGQWSLVTCADPTQCHPIVRSICDGSGTCA